MATASDLPSASPLSGTVSTGVGELFSTAKIFIVDDCPVVVKTVQKHLRSVGFDNLMATTESSEAVDLVIDQAPDIVLLDLNMPQPDGLSILDLLRQNQASQQVPVLICTASTDPDTRLQAFLLGASDFLCKPIDPCELALRIRNVLLAKLYQARLVSYSEDLERQVAIRTAELEASQQYVINCLARAADCRDGDTGQHIIRVGCYASIIARELGFDRAYMALIEQAAKLHDVGKIGIPDAVLLKPGKFEPAEYRLMQKHFQYGTSISRQAPPGGSDYKQTVDVALPPVLRLAATIAETHHEQWDGSGYPQGLVGEAIPIEGRITAVADVFDALSTARSYKPAFSRERCCEILEAGRGSHFDPQVLNAFFADIEDIVKAQTRYMD